MEGKIKNIIFVSHKKAKCGVYEYGLDVSTILKKSKKYNFIRVECSSLEELENEISLYNPSVIIYNYAPPVLPWITTNIIPFILYKNNIKHINIPQIGIVHEVTQKKIDKAGKSRKKYILSFKGSLINKLFDYYIAPDPTIIIKKIHTFKTGRLIPKYKNIYKLPATTTIGSFGFGTPNKGFEKIVKCVQDEFDEAIIRFNIPNADFGDKNGESARKIINNCYSLIYKKGIKLTISNDFLEKEDLLNFIAQNTINIFLYQNPKGESRGISSVIDNALAVQRPICISKSSMFRHLFNVKPSICIEDNDIKTIIKNNFAPLKKYSDLWTGENLIGEYEKIIDSIL